MGVKVINLINRQLNNFANDQFAFKTLTGILTDFIWSKTKLFELRIRNVAAK